MTIYLPEDAKYTLQDIAWDADVLRRQVQLMMKRHRLGPADLIKAWDRNGDEKLTVDEFLTHLRKLFRSGARDGQDDLMTQLWTGEIEPVATRLFDVLTKKKDWMSATSGGVSERKIDVVALQKWLHEPPNHLNRAATPPLKPRTMNGVNISRSTSQDAIGSEAQAEAAMRLEAEAEQARKARAARERAEKKRLRNELEAAATRGARRMGAFRRADEHVQGEIRRLSRPRTAGSLLGMANWDIPMQRWEVPLHLESQSFRLPSKHIPSKADIKDERRRVKRELKLALRARQETFGLPQGFQDAHEPYSWRMRLKVPPPSARRNLSNPPISMEAMRPISPTSTKALRQMDPIDRLAGKVAALAVGGNPRKTKSIANALKCLSSTDTEVGIARSHSLAGIIQPRLTPPLPVSLASHGQARRQPGQLLQASLFYPGNM